MRIPIVAAAVATVVGVEVMAAAAEVAEATVAGVVEVTEEATVVIAMAAMEEVVEDGDRGISLVVHSAFSGRISNSMKRGVWNRFMVSPRQSWRAALLKSD